MRFKSFLIVIFFFLLPLLCRAGQVDTSDVLWQQLTTVNCYCLAFSPDSKLLASGHDVVTYIWDVAKGNLIHTIVPGSNTTALSFSPDGRYLATGGDYIKIWDTQTWDSVNVITQAGGGIGNMEFTHDGTKLVATAFQSCLSIFETTNWSLIKRINNFPYLKDQHGNGQRSVEFESISYDDRYIAFSSYSGTWTFIYDFMVDSIVRQINNSVAAKFSPVRNELVYYYYDSWPAKQNKGLIYYKLDTGDSTYININNVNDFAFSPDGNKLSIVFLYGSVKLWSLINNYSIYQYNTPLGNYNVTINSLNSYYVAAAAGPGIFLLNSHWNNTFIQESMKENNKLIVYPNPNYYYLGIEFNLKKPEFSELELIDVSGKIFQILPKTYLDTGIHKYNFDTQKLLNGIYEIRLINEDMIETQKLIISK